MNPLETWTALRHKWKQIVVFVLLGVIAGSAYVLVTPREYSASTELFVGIDSSASAADLAQGGTYSQQQARNYANVADTQIVLEPVIDALGLDATVASLGRRVSATVPLNTSLITIEVTDQSPQRAAATANAVTTSLANRVQKLVPANTDGTVPVKLETVQSATVPSRPSSPNIPVAIVVGALVGLLIGAAFAILRRRISTTVHTADQVRSVVPASLLGSIGADQKTATEPLVGITDDYSQRAEEYRRLRTNVGFLQAGRDEKVLVVTSSVPGEGKSTVAANLASSVAALGKRVCLVEADLRRPALGRYLDLDNTIGLTTVLTGDVPLEVALQTWGPHGMSVLLSGDLPPNPSELLSTQAAARLFRSLADDFDLVVVDSPPLAPVTDAAILGGAFGGVALVVGSGFVDSRQLRSTSEALDSAHARVLGIIVNFADPSSATRYSKQYGYAPLEARRTSKHAQEPSSSRQGTSRRGRSAGSERAEQEEDVASN